MGYMTKILGPARALINLLKLDSGLYFGNLSLLPKFPAPGKQNIFNFDVKGTNYSDPGSKICPNLTCIFPKAEFLGLDLYLFNAPEI